jgi:putative acetyltransferase
MVEIRSERFEDIPSIRDVNDRAFGQPREGRIVDALRSNRAVLLSLVATVEERVAGHILYSSATIDSVPGAALGPVAVLPECQRQGVGTALITAGNERLRQSGCPFIVLVGHPGYYPRFGFRPASAHNIRCQWKVRDEAFMVLVLDEERMRNVTGLAVYRDEFSTDM